MFLNSYSYRWWMHIELWIVPHGRILEILSWSARSSTYEIYLSGKSVDCARTDECRMKKKREKLVHCYITIIRKAGGRTCPSATCRCAWQNKTNKDLLLKCNGKADQVRCWLSTHERTGRWSFGDLTMSNEYDLLVGRRSLRRATENNYIRCFAEDLKALIRTWL